MPAKIKDGFERLKVEMEKRGIKEVNAEKGGALIGSTPETMYKLLRGFVKEKQMRLVSKGIWGLE